MSNKLSKFKNKKEEKEKKITAVDIIILSASVAVAILVFSLILVFYNKIGKEDIYSGEQVGYTIDLNGEEYVIPSKMKTLQDDGFVLQYTEMKDGYDTKTILIENNDYYANWMYDDKGNRMVVTAVNNTKEDTDVSNCDIVECFIYYNNGDWNNIEVNGIGMHSTKEDVLEKFGEPRTSGTSNEGNTEFVYVTQDKNGELISTCVIEFKEDLLWSIHLVYKDYFLQDKARDTGNPDEMPEIEKSTASN